MGREVVVRRPAAGFALPPVSGVVEEKKDGDWAPVVVAEEKDGYVVKDKRRVK